MSTNKNKKSEKKPMIQTKVKKDNSIEVSVTKNPGKTLGGKIVAWFIIAGTVLVPLACLIYLLVLAMK